MTSLTRGANSPIDTATTTVEVTGARQGTANLFAFQLGADLQVRTDADLVFFNNPTTPEGAVTLAGGRVTLNLDTVPASIDTLAVAVALDENAPGSLAEVPGTLDKTAAVPTLVLFFTDGGFHARAQITALMRKVSALPAFWQFIGIGKSSVGVLEELDNLTGRLVDNAGFFAVENVDTLSDAALYELLLSEYPDWLRPARTARILS